MGLGANPNGSHNWELPAFISGLGQALKVPGHFPKASSHAVSRVLVFSLWREKKDLLSRVFSLHAFWH